MKFDRDELIGLLEYMLDRSFYTVDRKLFYEQFDSEREGRFAVRLAEREGLIDCRYRRLYLQDGITKQQIRSIDGRSIQYEVSWYES